MNKKTIITALLALIAITGHGQIKCHVEGTLETDAWGDEIIICEAGTELRAVNDPRFHVKANDGHFTYDIETDLPKLYQVCFAKPLRAGGFVGKFLAENCNVNVTMYKDKRVRIVSNGEEGRKHAIKDSIEEVRFRNPMEEINNKLNNPGLQLKQQRDSIYAELRHFRIAYAEEHPMLRTLYDVLDAIQGLIDADIIANFNKSDYEPYLTLYHNKLANYYPNHPIHEQIAIAEAAYHLQPGKPYIDYTVRNADGQLVPISTLTKGKVALIDLWASWCGPCRRHSIAMIPIYEKYKDKGFTVIAIARERSRKAMKNAAKIDGYPWTSLLELNDENGVWRKNGANNAGGVMFLIDRNGTILSTSTKAEELEPLIKKALNIE